VGGHCIPVYPHFLFNDDPQLRIPPLAREINEAMGRFTVDLIEDRIGSLDGQPVLVLGVAYRDDVREDAFSSAFRLRDELRAAGAVIHAHDPYFDDGHLRALGFEPWSFESAAPVRVAILQAAHAAYREMDPSAIPGLELLVDGRNVLERRRFEDAGVRYVGIGR
jgi:UDP-N-acetyl-D-mannosaminuronic acid dehydrogenase